MNTESRVGDLSRLELQDRIIIACLSHTSKCYLWIPHLKKQYTNCLAYRRWLVGTLN